MTTFDPEHASHEALTKSQHDFSEASAAVHSDEFSVLPQKISRYEIQAELGSGGFGRVYKAFDPMIRRSVAVKVAKRPGDWSVAEEDVFLDEARKAAKLSHRNVVTVYDAGKCPTHGVYIVMEHIDGETLAQSLSSQPMSMETAVHVVRQIASALNEAHQQGLVHRDVKPSNILLDARGDARITDFGMALLESQQVSERGNISGTVPYMSPEQISGDAHLLDGRSDIWSLGAVLYQCLTGRRPFTGETFEIIREEILRREPKPVRQINDRVPRRLEEVCLKCLSKNVSDRFATGHDLDEELRHSLVKTDSGHAEDSAAPLSSEQLVDSFRREGRRWIAAITVVSISIAALVVVAVWMSIANAPVPVQASSQPTRPSALTGTDMAAGGLAPVATEPLQHRVMVLTKPQNARIVVYPVVEPYGFLDGEQRVEADSRSPATLELSPGTYLVVAALDDGRFHEVYRIVPEQQHGLPLSAKDHFFWRNRADGTVEWPEVMIPAVDVTDGMGSFDGSESFQVGVEGNPEVPVHNRSLGGFYLDAHEVAWGEFLRNNKNFPPPSLMHLRNQLPDAALPIAGIWYNDAASYAESVGKRLPTEAEYEFAATAGGTRTFPWGDDPSLMAQWPLVAAGTPQFDRIEAGNPVFGLYSNVAEWTSSWASVYPPLMDYLPGLSLRPEATWIVRGGPYSVIKGKPDPVQFSSGPRSRIGQNENALHPGLGFRCCRSARPRLEATDLERFVRD